ncbi:MAG: hypothetical protein J7M38_08795, partial [Armatimonadetes bacterium]|nr:hypothetical protein [Armatimonadota bacterium]
LSLAALLVLGVIGWAVWRLHPPSGGADAHALLRAAARALHETALEGTVITRVRVGDEWREAHAEVHRGEGRSRVRYLDGPARGMTLYREGRQVWATGETGRVPRALKLGADPTEALSERLMRDGYNARITGHGTVAGRPVTLVTAGGRGGRLVLGVDRETGFPLLMKRYDGEGRLRLSTVYDEVDFSAAPPEPAEAPPSVRRGPRRAEHFDTLAQITDKVDFTLYRPGYVPDGYTLAGVRLQQTPRGRMVGARYTNGLQMILIVQHARNDGRIPSGLQERMPGRVRAHRSGRESDPRGIMRLRGGMVGDALRRAMDGTQVLVMGSAPRAELVRVADSLEPIP